MNPQDTGRFQQVESQYFILRGKLDTGHITRAQFDSELQSLTIADAQGRFWAINPDSGRWHRYDGQAWQPADPYMAAPPPPMASAMPPPMTAAPARTAPPVAPPQAQTQAPAPASSQGGGCGGCLKPLACGCLVLVLLLVAGGGGLYWGITSGALTLPGIMTLLGMGPARIEVNNFRDDRINVLIQPMDNRTDDTSLLDTTLKLSSFDVKSYRTTQTGRFRVMFLAASNGASLGVCNLTMRNNDQYQFVALPDRLVVNRVNSPPATGRDLLVATSALCR